MSGDRIQMRVVEDALRHIGKMVTDVVDQYLKVGAMLISDYTMDHFQTDERQMKTRDSGSSQRTLMGTLAEALSLAVKLEVEKNKKILQGDVSSKKNDVVKNTGNGAQQDETRTRAMSRQVEMEMREQIREAGSQENEKGMGRSEEEERRSLLSTCKEPDWRENKEDKKTKELEYTAEHSCLRSVSEKVEQLGSWETENKDNSEINVEDRLQRKHFEVVCSMQLKTDGKYMLKEEDIQKGDENEKKNAGDVEQVETDEMHMRKEKYSGKQQREEKQENEGKTGRDHLGHGLYSGEPSTCSWLFEDSEYGKNMKLNNPKKYKQILDQRKWYVDKDGKVVQKKNASTHKNSWTMVHQ
ncbi:hypothetical protein GE061_001536 [Apolygus lucorum]|uniref:Uncharacterized protein n=1 Tax=Apolygus lucorum TaxID=248454 RepID=A0A8S9Y7C6_APOLU|nr:hypothetical protein GE061_001536 [Apolygus lucorum]